MAEVIPRSELERILKLLSEVRFARDFEVAFEPKRGGAVHAYVRPARAVILESDVAVHTLYIRREMVLDSAGRERWAYRIPELIVWEDKQA